MKKIILSFYSILIFINLSFAQNFALTSVDGNDITNDTLVVEAETIPDIIYGYVHVKNISNVSMDVVVKKIENSILDSTVNTFCWGVNCYPPTTFISNSYSLEPGIVDESFYCEYYPFGNSGQSSITFVFYNERDASDSAFVVITIKTGIVASKNVLRNLQYTFSKPYPNPAKEFTQIDFSIEKNKNAKMEIYNILGKKVEYYNLSNGQDKVLINTSEFQPGIYFYSFIINKTVINSGKFKVIK
ncbi:MAG: T9SS type A sorting domain-containing protein [Chlorobi bacterium]|nr:T9SS type A sorting domain-containing protein [Chlorobiota bacterium]